MGKLTKAQKRFLSEIELDGPFGLWPTWFEFFKVKRLIRDGFAEKRGPFLFITPAGRAALKAETQENSHGG